MAKHGRERAGVDNSAKNNERLWTKINFWCCGIAVCLSVALSVLSILSRVYKIDIWVHLYIFIAFASAAVADITLLIISWAKIRRIKKGKIASNGEDKNGD